MTIPWREAIVVAGICLMAYGAAWPVSYYQSERQWIITIGAAILAVGVLLYRARK